MRGHSLLDWLQMRYGGGARFPDIFHVPTYTFEPVELNAINDQIERLTQFLDEAKCPSE